MTALIMPPYTFPREMPVRWDGAPPFERATFKPGYTQAKAPTRGALVQVVNLAPDLWVMEFSSHVMDFDEGQEYLAWLQSLRGGTRLFKAWHPLLEYPRAYVDTGWTGLVVAGGATPFAGTGSLLAIALQRDGVSIGGLPAGFELKIGDQLSLELPGGSRSLHAVMEEATADIDGEVDLTIEPIVPLSATLSPAPEVLFHKPWCFATLDADSVSGPWEPGQIARVSFRAEQSY